MCIRDRLKNEPGVLSLILVGTNLMNYLAATVAAYLLARRLGHAGADIEIYTTVLVTPVLFVFGEVVPKNLFQANADTLMRRGSMILVFFYHVFRFTGIVPALTKVSQVFAGLLPGRRDAGDADAPKRRVAAMLRQALMDRAPETELTDVVDRVVTLSETPLYRVMVPRHQVVTISAGADRKTLVKTARTTPHSRLPVHDHGRQQIIGVIKVDQLLKSSDWSCVGEKIQDVSRLSGHTTVAAAIAQAQQARHAMIIVVDRRGQMVGIATLKDLLEEIVGELSAW